MKKKRREEKVVFENLVVVQGGPLIRSRGAIAAAVDLPWMA